MEERERERERENESEKDVLPKFEKQNPLSFTVSSF